MEESGMPVGNLRTIPKSSQEKNRAFERVSEPKYAGLHTKIQQQLQNFQGGQKRREKLPITLNGDSRQRTKPKKGQQPLEGGKKRDRKGNVLEKTAALPKPQPTAGLDDNDGFQKEMKSLGGTVEDLELIADAESDSEVEDSNKAVDDIVGKGLHKGISNILKEIALAGGAEEVLDESSADEDDISEANETLKHEAPRNPTEAQVPGKSRRAGAYGLRIEPQSDWFNAVKFKFDPSKKPTYTLSLLSLEKLHKYAQTLLAAENESYKTSQQSSSSQSFYNTVIASGTLSDKISALTLAVQESPVHNAKALESLVGLAKKRSRVQAIDVLRALKDLLAQGSLLPTDRKLHAFSSNPVLLSYFGNTKTWTTGDKLPSSVEEKHLIMWCFESWLKEQYFEVLKILEIWCNDEIEFSKSRAVSYVFELLKEKPEQESNLLRLLINKLGDPTKKLASQTSYLLMQLLSAHPAMKETVVLAMESDFLFRPGQSLHAKYYAIVTLNQTALSMAETGVAEKLLDVYFALFIGLLKPSEDEKDKKLGEVQSSTRGERRRNRGKSKSKVESGQPQAEELQEKLTSAILTGINRAYPYTGTDRKSLTSHVDTLFKITHSSNFNTSIQAMVLIQQLSGPHEALADRFYKALYESLLDARLATSSKQQIYLNLLHRALKADVNLKRVKAFVKRITQISSLHQPSFICGTFFLLQDLEATFPGLTGLVDQPEEHDEEEEVFKDVDEINEDSMHPSRQAAVNGQGDSNTNSTHYDGRKRDPEHSRAENSCLWEALPLLAHFHPSVALSSAQHLQHKKLPGRPNIDLHTLIHFLDRFVYRNPKLATSNLRGSSIMQPMVGGDTHTVLIGSTTAGKQQLPVNTTDFRAQKEDDVAADDVFFHKYFSSLGNEQLKKKAKAKQEDRGDDESVGDDEDAVWKAMMESAPDLEGMQDAEDDVDMSDFDSELDEELDGMSDSEEESEDIDLNTGAGSSGDDARMAHGSDSDDSEILNLDANSSSEEEHDAIVEDEEENGYAAAGTAPSASKKGKHAEARAQRRKMKNLPTFASAAAYAKMLDNESDEDLG